MRRGLYDAILVAIGDVLPPVARLAVYPMWKIGELCDDGRVTLAEARVLSEYEKRARR